MFVEERIRILIEKIFKRELETSKKNQLLVIEKISDLEDKLNVKDARVENIEADIRNISHSLSSLAKNVRMNNAHIETDRKDIENAFENIQNISRDLSSLAENIRMNNVHIETDRKDIENAFENIQNISRDLSSLAENVRMNNAQIEADYGDIEWIKSKLKVTMKKLDRLQISSENLNNDSDKNTASESFGTATGENAYKSVDYFGFENYFRGSREKIKETQKQYLPYFEGRSNVLDLGCGRGEFLELLKECQIGGSGIDLYPEFVEYCNSRGLSVELGDAIEYLRKQDKVDGIFAGQLIEHLSIGQIIEICELAYEKLEEGSYVILETPNPTSLAIYTNAFYVDPSHQKPVHPLTMQYLMKCAGFNAIEICYTDSSRVPIQIPELKGNGIENFEAFNQSMQKVSDLLFGSQDYAIIARR